MITYTHTIPDIIRRRSSCRRYDPRPIEPGLRDGLSEILAVSPQGPFKSRARFELVSVTDDDLNALKGLGTYGFIKGATGFIIGAVERGEKDMEDYGYLLERIILLATDIDLGTCWLGGTFSKSNFSQKISLKESEVLPAAAAVGYVPDKPRWFDSFIRRRAGSDNRLPWTELFFDKTFQNPLSTKTVGPFAAPLEMVRLGPSASNKQPWRIIRDGTRWHFYLQRTIGYGERNMSLFKLADLQRVDMGIAMCHFELTAREMGLSGRWTLTEPKMEKPEERTEYIVTWEEQCD
ncbi:MAG TPA: nitroreductase family protein [Syntrophales bacterium]|nr:nitroreductase family protein [Syntrophales bacterium]